MSPVKSKCKPSEGLCVSCGQQGPDAETDETQTAECLEMSASVGGFGLPRSQSPAFLDVQGLGLDPEHHKTNIFLLLLFLLTVVCNCNFEKWPLTVTVIVPAASDAVILKLTLSV